jgi:hypothetical protein
MTMFYSKSTGGFYDTAIHGDAIPADAVEITAAAHATLLEAQSDGKRIVADASGHPVAVEPAPPTLDEARDVQSERIRVRYEAACEAPVIALGATWNGGFDSAIKLDAAMRLSQAAGAHEVTFFDLANAGHVLDFNDALTIVVAVAADFQLKLARKQNLMAAIAGAATVEDVLAVVW